MNKHSLDSIGGKQTLHNIFQASRGIRQGFPLSSFLYILVVEMLRQKLELDRQLGEILGLSFALGIKSLNHSHFADDTLLLGCASSQISRNFYLSLSIYCKASSGLINHLKIHIYGWNDGPRTLESISRTMGIQLTFHWDNLKYLGLPITF